MIYILWIIQIIFVPLVSPLAIGITRKVKAKFQNRKGASVFQPYSDIIKLFQKNEIISNDASWIFRYSPYIIFSITVLIGAIIPTISIYLNISSDFLLIVYLFMIGTFFIALAGMDAGSAFGGFGSSREMLVAALTEGGLILSFLTLAIITKSSDLFSIIDSVTFFPSIIIFPVILAFISYFISMLAETGRFPFDNPATHLELTMIHEAMILEYSGKRLALMEWAAANKYLIFIVLGANLFFPWGISQSILAQDITLAIVLLLAKISIFAFAVAFIESIIAKFRVFRLPDLLFTSFVLSIIAIALAI